MKKAVDWKKEYEKLDKKHTRMGKELGETSARLIKTVRYLNHLLGLKLTWAEIEDRTNVWFKKEPARLDSCI